MKFDELIKITIPELEIITWAVDMEDAIIAITEAIEAFKYNVEAYGTDEEKQYYKNKF